VEAAARPALAGLGNALSPIRIHLDTDIGGDLDDLCALALLLGWPDVELTGVTTVLEASNPTLVPIEVTAHTALLR
jgi:inosine-uridine nucleoside N-ribohydrolase